MNNDEKLAKIAVNKSLLKEYLNSSNERIVYMNDGTEFQIQIFNPYTYIIGVSFGFNENLQENSNLLVLRPGERVWLDRYLDNESHLLFSTYEVGSSQSVKEAIKNNGNLCIKFFKERQQNYNGVYIKEYNPCIYSTYVNPNTIFTSDCNYNVTSLTANVNDYTASTASTVLTAASINSDNIVDILNKTKSIETGRIERGNHSNQKFNNVYKDFEYWAFKTEYIKILPTSQKQINSNDLKKIYCHECGRKINQKFKFCPYCGAKL